MYQSIADMKAMNVAIGHHFFDKETMKHWGSKIHGGVRHGCYFITSEPTAEINSTTRTYHARIMSKAGAIKSVGGDFGHGATTLAEAKERIETHYKQEMEEAMQFFDRRFAARLQGRGSAG